MAALEVKMMRGGLGLKAIEVSPAISQVPMTLEDEHRSGIFEREPDSSYFWSDEWQEGEREADEDIREGRVSSFDDLDKALDYLRNLR